MTFIFIYFFNYRIWFLHSLGAFWLMQDLALIFYLCYPTGKASSLEETKKVVVKNGIQYSTPILPIKTFKLSCPITISFFFSNIFRCPLFRLSYKNRGIQNILLENFYELHTFLLQKNKHIPFSFFLTVEVSIALYLKDNIPKK